MDHNQYRPEHSYEYPAARPGYPTPPPSYSHYQVQTNRDPVYTNSGVYSPHSQSYDRTSTPLSSVTSSPPSSESTVDPDNTLTISTVFHPGNIPAPDTVLSSSDGVVFFVHAQTILNSCPTSFKPYLYAPLSDQRYRTQLISLDAPSVELNIILHTLYGTSPSAHSPSIETLVSAVDRMSDYALSPQSLIRPSTPLHDLLLSHAPLHPLEVYALAAHHSLSSLAVTASSHLLSYDLATITDDVAERIGAVSLNKLLQLHAGRSTSLKAILLQPPHPHSPTKQCGFEDQKKLTRAWALVTAYLAWDARPDLSTHTMQITLNPLLKHLSCELCHQGLKNRIKDVVVQWVSVKCTI